MISTLLAIAFFSTSAQAGEPSKGMPMPSVGATVSIKDCETKILAAPWNTRNAGQLVIDEARAQSICLDAKGDYKIAEAQAKAITTRAEAEAKLIENAGTAASNGGSVTYRSDGITVQLATGPAAEWQAYGTAVSHGTGYTGLAVDPRFAQVYTLDQGRSAFMSHPAVPGATVTPVADGGGQALSTCQRALAQTAGQLQQCSGN